MSKCDDCHVTLQQQAVTGSTGPLCRPRVGGASAAALLELLPLPTGQGRYDQPAAAPDPARRRCRPAPLMTPEAGSLMQAVTLVPLQKPGLNSHRADGSHQRPPWLAGISRPSQRVSVRGELGRASGRAEKVRVPAVDQVLPNPEHEGACSASASSCSGLAAGLACCGARHSTGRGEGGTARTLAHGVSSSGR